MTLELIIGEAVYGFASGFAYGTYIDRKIGFNQEFAEYTLKGCEGCSKIEKCDKYSKSDNSKLKSVRSKLEVAVSLANSLLVSMINLNPNIDTYTYLTATAETGIATYLGIKAGQYVSKLIRNNAKLKPEEKKAFFDYLLDFERNTFYEDNIKANKSLEKICDYISDMAKKKKNVKLVLKMHDTVRHAMVRSSVMGSFKKAIEESAKEYEKEKKKHGKKNKNPRKSI